MARRFATLAAVVAGASTALAQDVLPPGEPPLYTRVIPWSKIPFQVDTIAQGRGPQSGYTQCNSTTEGPSSNCQTGYLNALDDFCLWSPPNPNSSVADWEAAMVAWCTKPGHGSRIIPQGAITGVTFMTTPDYVQVTGTMNQALLNLQADDGGGELDPHGADERGNPLGSLMYSNAFKSADQANPANDNYTQVHEWHNFMGSGQFCFKVCNPAGPNAAGLCQHIYDRIGCAYNAPGNYDVGIFQSCQGESQDPPGVYTGSNGAVTTYHQPAESLGPISTMPYTARIPKSSNCVTMASSALFANAPAATGASSSAPVSSAPAASSGSAAASGSGSAAVTSKPASSTSTAKPTTSSSSAAGFKSEIDGSAMMITAALGIVGMIAGVALL